MDGNILIIGDMHLDASIMDAASSLIGPRNVGTVVTLGDYMDDWHAGTAERVGMAKALERWTKRLASDSVDVRTLLGNHDVPYYLGPDHPYIKDVLSDGAVGFDPKAMTAVHEVYSRIPFHVATAIRANGVDWLCSHAGMTQGWRDECLPDSAHDDAATIAAALDTMDWSRLWMCGRGRGGVAPNPSPLWADISELTVDPAWNLNQMVGHTPVRTVSLVDDDVNDAEMMFADTFSRMQSGAPIGDGTVALLEPDGRITRLRLPR